MSKNGTGKLTLVALILMIFTSVFGFNNIPRAFFLMGYSAIPWYIFGAVCFFIPYAFMMAEFGASFKEEKGGIYVWMQKSVGRKFAFIGTFMWFASYIVWINLGSPFKLNFWFRSNLIMVFIWTNFITNIRNFRSSICYINYILIFKRIK